jgi:hypothetical protein
MSVVDRLSGVLDRRLSRRSFVLRSTFAGSALATGGLDYLLRPGTAYAQLCDSSYCGNRDCDCSSTCCSGYTEFCCVLDGGYNSCPSGTAMAGWWMAEGSAYCKGPRYYMDCNSLCDCSTGCGHGYPFCEPGCDGLTCECAEGSCDNYLTGCFQFRYGQCNQDIGCIGRIKCRVVTCVPPWEIDPTCTTASATDNATANQNASCLGPDPTYPRNPFRLEEVMFLAKDAESQTIWFIAGTSKVGIPNLSDLAVFRTVLKGADLDDTVFTVSSELLQLIPTVTPTPA